MPGKLVLVRHSLPEMVAGVPQAQWRLSAAGKTAARGLAARLGGFDAPVVWSSPEPKALETAELVAGALDRRVCEAADLREHDRTSLGYLSRERLEAGVAGLLASDDELVFGDETARSVFVRMERALRRARAEAGRRDVVAVTHGAAAAIYVSRITGVDALAFWRSLGAPAAIVLDGARLERVLG